jgi:hypothetical protein
MVVMADWNIIFGRSRRAGKICDLPTAGGLDIKDVLLKKSFLR